ncbi:Rrf2 family transcriptional regulator [Clostridium sp. MB40-C1]|uniref:RrF2 family transcriptional regulator n=1 Tax=Clostridium sp. MB40-C1 TaxID=3070996 RepID=UPI0027DEF313|nr:Rrf2 family transcriptional regulator [Clostridium sp. MB40-C1]WMJ79376.1 Rrf2 family transcriptional regulator [Clostridium sp. MB40-C1]
MRFNQEVDYALRVVLYLCKLGYGEKIEAKVISEEENIPLRFLLKLLRKLKQAGIVQSYRGVSGGYALNKMPKDINLKSIVEAIEGPININKCLDDPTKCNLNRASTCEIHSVLQEVQNKILSELESVNFEQILEKSLEI